MEEEPRKKRSSKDKKIKKSGVRTKFMIESLRNEYYELRAENDRLRNVVQTHLPSNVSNQILSECYDPNAPKPKIDNIDDLAVQMAGTNVDDSEDE